MNKYEVFSMQFYGDQALYGNWAAADTVEANSYEDAVERWAEQSDQNGDYTIISEGEHGPVLVRKQGETKYKTFTIDAESVPRYYAKEENL